MFLTVFLSLSVSATDSPSYEGDEIKALTHKLLLEFPGEGTINHPTLSNERTKTHILSFSFLNGKQGTPRQ